MKIKITYQKKGVKVFYKNSTPTKELIKVANCILSGNKASSLKIVKLDKGREVYKCTINNRNYYLKRYCYRSLKKKTKNIFCLSEAVRALQMSYRLEHRGLPVVRPIAAVTHKNSMFNRDSLFITEEFNGDDLQDFFANGSYNHKMKEEIIKGVASLWAGLYNNKILNGDPNLPGIMVNVTGKKIKFALVDMDNYRELSYLTRKRMLKNLIDFNAHSYSGLARMKNKRLSIYDRILFFKEFLKRYKSNNLRADDIHYIANETVNTLTRWGRQEAVNRMGVKK